MWAARSSRFKTFPVQDVSQAQHCFQDYISGFVHSCQVSQIAQTLARQSEELDHQALNPEVRERYALFDDRGRFFQERHDLEHIPLAKRCIRSMPQRPVCQKC